MAVSATAHGDGVYLLDADRRPLGNAVLSLDTRAGGILEAWEADGTSGAALALSGQKPHPPAPSALLAWMARNEPERFARIAHVLACKDWLRFCLTDTIGTDLTEASTSFTNVHSQLYDDAVLDLFGLGALRATLPPVAAPHEIVGTVTARAATADGACAGYTRRRRHPRRDRLVARHRRLCDRHGRYRGGNLFDQRDRLP